MNAPSSSDDQERRSLGDKLRQAREYVGFSQDEVAAVLKLPRTAITNIESGQRKVEAIELKRMAELYRRSVAYFTGEELAAEALPADVAHLARQAAKLSSRDRAELGRFADFLKQRSESTDEDNG